jgi:hypothetical protein
MNDSQSHDDRQVAVTIYNSGSALVHDRRTFALQTGENHLDFADVAEQIDPTSVIFRSQTDPAGTVVLEQNFAYDLVDLHALLTRYLDQPIELVAEDGAFYSGALLSGRGQEVILRGENGGLFAVRFDKIRDLRFPALPGGLLTRPTLRWVLHSETGGPHALELTYLTDGLAWTADYVVLLEQDYASLDLAGWVTLNNTSGASYPNAQVRLVAGEINRIGPAPEMVMSMSAPPHRAAAAPKVEQREFFEYQLYEIERRVTVADREQKQVEFVSRAGVHSQLIYTAELASFRRSEGQRAFTGARPVRIEQMLEFSTGSESGLDADLPAGRVRVYQRDADGAALLIGEDEIDHTPNGEIVQLTLGSPFDLVAECAQTDFRSLGKDTIEETWRVTVRNRKDAKDVTVRVVQALHRFSSWQVLESDMAYEKLSSDQLLFLVGVPAQGERSFSFRIRYAW